MVQVHKWRFCRQFCLFFKVTDIEIIGGLIWRFELNSVCKEEVDQWMSKNKVYSSTEIIFQTMKGNSVNTS
jgi:hypothetical protein